MADTPDRSELRRRAVEALIEAHYECGCDAALELDWLEKHPDDARAVVALLDALDSRDARTLTAGPARLATDTTTGGSNVPYA